MLLSVVTLGKVNYVCERSLTIPSLRSCERSVMRCRERPSDSQTGAVVSLTGRLWGCGAQVPALALIRRRSNETLYH